MLSELTFKHVPFNVLCGSGTQKILQSPEKARAVISQIKKIAHICKAKMYLVLPWMLKMHAKNIPLLCDGH